MLLPSSSSSSHPRAPLRDNMAVTPDEIELGGVSGAATSDDYSLRAAASRPQIIYCVVAREKVILTEFSSFAGNFATVTRILLEKISPHPNGQRKSYTYDNYVFHFITSEGLTYVCLTDVGMGQTVPLKFLDEVCGRFETSFLSASRTAVALQMNPQFQPVLRAVVEKFNQGSDSTNMDRIRAHIAEVSNNMIDNVDKILQRQEKIELLVEKTETLNRTAQLFRRQAIDVRRTLWWRDVRTKIIFATVTLILIFLIIMWLCGGSDFHNCASK